MRGNTQHRCYGVGDLHPTGSADRAGLAPAARPAVVQRPWSGVWWWWLQPHL